MLWEQKVAGSNPAIPTIFYPLKNTANDQSAWQMNLPAVWSVCFFPANWRVFFRGGLPCAARRFASALLRLAPFGRVESRHARSMLKLLRKNVEFHLVRYTDSGKITVNRLFP